MTFREAMDELKAKYGTTATLDYTLSVRLDGSEYPTIFAHGNGKCAQARTYKGAIAGLVALHAEADELPPGDE